MENDQPTAQDLSVTDLKTMIEQMDPNELRRLIQGVLDDFGYSDAHVVKPANDKDGNSSSDDNDDLMPK